MNCKNCGHEIVEYKFGWTHYYKNKGTSTFCDLFNPRCNCGNPEPKKEKVK